MHIDTHPLALEFPDYTSLIRDLKLRDAHFARLFDEFTATDKAIARAENGIEHLGDLALETLKKVRLSLKDQLHACLRAAQAG